MLGRAWHGKNRVRVAKVIRGDDGTHDFNELEVRIELEGGTASSFTHGDNRMVVATDTCKNHVYIVAKKHSTKVLEEFAKALAHSFLNEYDHVVLARIVVVEKPWTRLDSQGRLWSELSMASVHNTGRKLTTTRVWCTFFVFRQASQARVCKRKHGHALCSSYSAESW